MNQALMIPEFKPSALVTELPGELALSQSVEVLTPIMLEYLSNAVETARNTIITDGAELASASENANNLTKAIKALEAHIVELRRPLNQRLDAISAAAKPVLEVANAAKKAQLARVKAYQDYIEEERQRIIAEERAKAEAAERERQAAIREKERQVAEARAKAEAAEREKERLAWEAQQREVRATEALDQAQGNPEAFEAAAKGFDEGLRVQEQADAAALAAEEARRLEEEIQALSVPAAAVATVTAALPAPAKAKGTRTQKVVELLGVDLENLPAPYRLADEAKIKRAIKDGLIDGSARWVTFRVSEMVVGTGR